MFQFVDAELGPGKQGLTILVEFTPMDIKSMSKFSSKNQVNIPVYQCTSVPIYQCTNVSVYQYTSVPIYQCTSIPIYQCTNVPVYQCTGIPLYQCTNIPVYQYTYVPICTGLYNYSLFSSYLVHHNN